jgi:hypothetical protein
MSNYEKNKNLLEKNKSNLEQTPEQLPKDNQQDKSYLKESEEKISIHTDEDFQ